MEQSLVEPQILPQLSIPPSESVVDVRVIDSETELEFRPSFFWDPAIEGFESFMAPTYCFLISNGNRHILFDLGVRRDWQNLAPRTYNLVKDTTVVKARRNVSEILDDGTSGLSIRSTDVEAIVISHGHFDHIGDPSTFPEHTDLVVGEGFKTKYLPGYPANSDASILESDYSGHNLREISFTEGYYCLKVGNFDAFDYFGDGSFYLLDAPGHDIGHLCGLARVTTDPASFVFMGADACHHIGLIRPSQYLPLPKSISPSSLMRFIPRPCPGERFQAIHPNNCANEAFLKPSNGFPFPHYEDAKNTLRKIQELDAMENVLIMMAHDCSFKESIDFFPKRINAWRTNDIKIKTRWHFLKDFETAASRHKIINNHTQQPSAI